MENLDEILHFLASEIVKKTEEAKEATEYENFCILPKPLAEEHANLTRMADAICAKRIELERETEYYNARCKIFWHDCEILANSHKSMRINGAVLQVSKS
jgi:hypothetical protein